MTRRNPIVTEKQIDQEEKWNPFHKHHLSHHFDCGCYGKKYRDTIRQMLPFVEWCSEWEDDKMGHKAQAFLKRFRGESK